MTLRLPSPSDPIEAPLGRLNQCLQRHATERLSTLLGPDVAAALADRRPDPCGSDVAAPPDLALVRRVVRDAIRSGSSRVHRPGVVQTVNDDADVATMLDDGWVLECPGVGPGTLADAAEAAAAALLAHVRCVTWWSMGSALGPTPGWADFDRVLVPIGAPVRLSLRRSDGQGPVGTVPLPPGRALRVPPGVEAAVSRLDEECALVEIDLQVIGPSDDEVERRRSLSSGAGGILVESGPSATWLVSSGSRLATLDHMEPDQMISMMQDHGIWPTWMDPHDCT